MLRNFPNPIHTAVFELYGIIQPFGNGFLDEDLAAFFQQFYFFLLDGNGLVYLGGFVIEKGGDGLLFISWRKNRKNSKKIITIKS